MMVHCPKCGFRQPKDKYCASCGVDMDKYRPEKPSTLNSLLRNWMFQFATLTVIILGGLFSYIRYNNSPQPSPEVPFAEYSSQVDTQNLNEEKDDDFLPVEKPAGTKANLKTQEIQRLQPAPKQETTASPFQLKELFAHVYFLPNEVLSKTNASKVSYHSLDQIQKQLSEFEPLFVSRISLENSEKNSDFYIPSEEDFFTSPFLGIVGSVKRVESDSTSKIEISGGWAHYKQAEHTPLNLFGRLRSDIQSNQVIVISKLFEPLSLALKNEASQPTEALSEHPLFLDLFSEEIKGDFAGYYLVISPKKLR